jgi:uncharacterized membrane protein
LSLHFTHCHQLPERSFFWKGKQLPLCARCLGIQIGFVSLPFFMFNKNLLPLSISLILIMPTIIDGLTQAYLNRTSNNYLRLVTGIAAGIGLMSATSIIGKWVGKEIIKIIN